MDTIVRPPVAAPPSVGPAPHRRRWTRIVVVAVLCLVSVGLTVGSIWIANDVPLVQGSFGFGTRRSEVHETYVDAFDVHGYVYEVPVSRTGRFRYTFSIRNHGPLEVTIETVGTADSGGSWDLSRRAVRVDPDALVGPATTFERWHPFSLAPGREAKIEMEAVYHGPCIGKGDTISWNWEPITFSILGLTRHENIQVGVEVRFTGDGSCGGG